MWNRHVTQIIVRKYCQIFLLNLFFFKFFKGSSLHEGEILEKIIYKYPTFAWQRPVVDVSHVVKVRVVFGIYSIHKVVEKQRLVSLSGYITMVFKFSCHFLFQLNKCLFFFNKELDR